MRLLPLLVLCATSAIAQKPSKGPAHEEQILLLYPGLDPRLNDDRLTDQEFIGALNRSASARVPKPLLDEAVALRATLRADAAGLRGIAPALQANLATYRPETSWFADRNQAAEFLKNLALALQMEAAKPGALKALAVMTKARLLRDELRQVDAFVDMESIQSELASGRIVPESKWRLRARPNSRLAQTGLDPFGNSYGPQYVGRLPKIPAASYETLKLYVPASFWPPEALPQ